MGHLTTWGCCYWELACCGRGCLGVVSVVGGVSLEGRVVAAGEECGRVLISGIAAVDGADGVGGVMGDDGRVVGAGAC